MCPAAALHIELDLVDTQSNQEVPDIIILPPSEDVPVLIPTETVSISPATTAVTSPRSSALDNGICIMSILSPFHDFFTSGDQGTCSINLIKGQPSLPVLPVVPPEPANTVAVNPSHLGELQDRFHGFVLGPYWDRVGVVGFVKTTSDAPSPVPTSNDDAAKCDVSAVLMERDAAVKRAETSERELHAERQQRRDLENLQRRDLETLQRQMERKQRDAQITITERHESQRRKAGLGRRERHREERRAMQSQRAVAKKRYTRDTWRLYSATRNGKVS